MVCNRCIMVVQSELEKVGLHPLAITLGEVVLQEAALTSDQSQSLHQSFEQLGFEIIDDKKSRLIEKIKTLIVELVHHGDNELHTNLSTYLSAQLHHDYNYLSNLFSEVEGATIEKY
jgi:hypothetical protein